jgi:hypothetical protein
LEVQANYSTLVSITNPNKENCAMNTVTLSTPARVSSRVVSARLDAQRASKAYRAHVKGMSPSEIQADDVAQELAYKVAIAQANHKAAIIAMGAVNAVPPVA